MSQIDRASPNDAVANAVAAGPVSLRSICLADVIELTKPGIVKMVLVTTSVGFGMAALGRAWDPVALVLGALWCLIGTGLSGAGANALNMALEVARDREMERTRTRPVAAGKLSQSAAMSIGTVLASAGVITLALGTNPVAAGVSMVTILSYVLIYTPLKPVSPLATLVGAIPGALPPLIGWTAASAGPWSGLLEPGGWSLFALVFAWQVPHFLAIAWKYRDEYARAGHRVLPVVDPDGHRTARAALLWSLTLIPLSFVPALAMPGHLGPFYIGVATLAGSWMVWRSIGLLRERTDSRARRLFLASIAYLPIVLVTMVIDAVVSGLL